MLGERRPDSFPVPPPVARLLIIFDIRVGVGSVGSSPSSILGDLVVINTIVVEGHQGMEEEEVMIVSMDFPQLGKMRVGGVVEGSGLRKACYFTCHPPFLHLFLVSSD